MLEHPSTTGSTRHANGVARTQNEQVHASQRALVHYAVTHPGDRDVLHRPHRSVMPTRRYVLGGEAMQAIRERVELEVYAELDTRAGLTIDYIAHFAALAAEHAIQGIGVEAAP